MIVIFYKIFIKFITIKTIDVFNVAKTFIFFNNLPTIIFCTLFFNFLNIFFIDIFAIYSALEIIYISIFKI